MVGFIADRRTRANECSQQRKGRRQEGTRPQDEHYDHERGITHQQPEPRVTRTRTQRTKRTSAEGTLTVRGSKLQERKGERGKRESKKRKGTSPAASRNNKASKQRQQAANTTFLRQGRHIHPATKIRSTRPQERDLPSSEPTNHNASNEGSNVGCGEQRTARRKGNGENKDNVADKPRKLGRYGTSERSTKKPDDAQGNATITNTNIITT